VTRRALLFFVPAFLFFLFSNIPVLFAENLGEDPNNRLQRTNPPTNSNSNGNLYINNGKIGLGITWSPANSALYSGFTDVRYWVNRWFGIDGGIGLIHSSFDGTNNLLGVGNQNTFQLTTFQIQGMVPIIERQHFVFYGDLGFIPEVGSPNFGSEILPGIGIEYAFPEYSNFSVYFQLNPVPLFGSTGVNATTHTFTDYVVYTPAFLGFHFYF
jgi:hypothetical protein